MSPNRTLELIKPILVLFAIIFVLQIAYRAIFNDDEDDEFSITITYDCHAVLENRNYYSGQLVDMCEELRRTR